MLHCNHRQAEVVTLKKQLARAVQKIQQLTRVRLVIAVLQAHDRFWWF